MPMTEPIMWYRSLCAGAPRITTPKFYGGRADAPPPVYFETVFLDLAFESIGSRREALDWRRSRGTDPLDPDSLPPGRRRPGRLFVLDTGLFVGHVGLHDKVNWQMGCFLSHDLDVTVTPDADGVRVYPTPVGAYPVAPFFHLSRPVLGTQPHNVSADIQEALADGKVSWSRIASRLKLAGLHRDADLLRQALGAARQEAQEAAAALERRPPVRLIRSPEDAEAVCAEWLAYFDRSPAMVTRKGADGGIDVYTGRTVGQVKMEAVRTARPALQALYGAATAESKRAIFFCLAGYTRDAVLWADKVGLPLFQFDYQGTPSPINRAARSVLARIEDQ